MLELEALDLGRRLQVRRSLEQLLAQTDNDRVVLLHGGQEEVFILEQLHQPLAVHETLWLAFASTAFGEEVSLQMDEFGDNLFWPALLEAFAHQVLPTRQEGRGVGLDDADVLEEVVQGEQQAHGHHVMHLVHLDHHATVVLNRCEPQDAVLDQIIDMALLFSRCFRRKLAFFFVAVRSTVSFVARIAVVEHDTEALKHTDTVKLGDEVDDLIQTVLL